MESSIRVLLLDDDPSYADLVTRMLEREDERLAVTAETNAVDAAARFESGDVDVDCVVSDYEMPEMDGLELLERVRRSHADLPFVLFTGAGSEKLADRAFAAGANDYIRKNGHRPYAVLANRIVDVVESSRSVRSAQRAQRRLRDLAEKSPDALWMFSDGFDELIFVNSAAAELFGLSIEELRADPQAFLEAVHPDDRERVERTMDRLSAGKSAEVEYRGDESTGYRRWLWAQGEPVVGEDGTVDRIVGFVRDVTERKERERALAALNDVAVDLDGRESVEGICERAIEASQDILEFDLSIVDIEEDGSLRKAALSEDISGAETTTMTIEEGIAGKTYRTGESFLIEDVEECPEADPQGPFRSAISIPIGTHGIFQAVATEPNAFDESDLELAELLVSHAASALDRLDREQQLHEQNERLEEFTRIVSHDLRNPLNVLEGSLELARSECDSTHLEEAEAVRSRVEAIVEDTLTWVSEGQQVDEPTVVDLETIARNCWRNVATERVTLEVTVDGRIRADPGRLRHLLENCFRNAVEHAGPEATVRVGERANGFYVEDDGPGIPEADRERVFDPGYTDGGSSGFGLAIVRQVAEAHGWTVRVTDGSSGGARFEFADVERIGG